MTPRPKKHRHCACPHRPAWTSVYKPAGLPLTELQQTHVDIDELEALRLCDGAGLTQEDAGQRMGVSRGTIQRLVASGRKKLIDAIIAGHVLMIETHPREDMTTAERTEP